MKVCTDSCIFGGLLASRIESGILAPCRMLDIGCGTGLLSLMLAQVSLGTIDAVEIHHESYIQSKANFALSPWNDRLAAYHADIRDWRPNRKYDLLVSNPPFFENDLKPASHKKLISKHEHSLSLDQLFRSADLLLADKGMFAVLLPRSRALDGEEIAGENGFYLDEEISVKNNYGLPPFRSVLVFSKIKVQTRISELTIKNENGEYTSEFKNLLRDYYLSIT